MPFPYLLHLLPWPVADPTPKLRASDLTSKSRSWLCSSGSLWRTARPRPRRSLRRSQNQGMPPTGSQQCRKAPSPESQDSPPSVTSMMRLLEMLIDQSSPLSCVEGAQYGTYILALAHKKLEEGKESRGIVAAPACLPLSLGNVPSLVRVPLNLPRPPTSSREPESLA